MINYEFPPFDGGTGRACARLLDAFATHADISIDLVTSGPQPEIRSHRLGERIVVHRLPIPKRDLHYWRAGELARWTLRARRHARGLVSVRGYDVCHCWAGWPSGVVGYGLRARIPYIVSLRGSDVPGYNPRLRLARPAAHAVRRAPGLAPVGAHRRGQPRAAPARAPERSPAL